MSFLASEEIKALLDDEEYVQKLAPISTFSAPYPYSSFFNELIELLRVLAEADEGGEATPAFYQAKQRALSYLAGKKLR